MKRAWIFLTDEHLHQMLELDDGLTIIGIAADPARLGIGVYITGDALSEVAPGTEPPMLAGALNTQVHYDKETNQVFYRWGWSKPGPDLTDYTLDISALQMNVHVVHTVCGWGEFVRNAGEVLGWIQTHEKEQHG